MDHLVIPLDDAHAEAASRLGQSAAEAAGLDEGVERPAPHITVLAYQGLSAAAAGDVVAEVAARTAPFLVHAHGYGFFAGDGPFELSLYVPVARNPPLAALHLDLCEALARAGAEVAGWSTPDAWLPHITLLDRCMEADVLARAVARLAERHHPSWRVAVDRVALTGGWPERGRAEVIRLTGAAT